MKRAYKFLTLTGFSAVLCLFLAMPAMAQHRGGGGGGGGGHAGGGGGGGFSGGGRSGGGFSGHSSGIAPSHFSGGTRAAGGNRGYIGGSHAVAGGRGYGGRYGARYGAAGVSGAHRGYIAGSAGAGVYGHGGYYGHYGWGAHGGYYYYGGYYGSLYYPWLGYGYGYLPYGYFSFYWGGYPYYYSGGFFYQYDNDQYTVVEPPVGAAVNTLPKDAQSIVIDGQQYYEQNGVYYKAVTKDDGTVVYEIAGKDGQLNTSAAGASSVMPKVGDIVSQLPADCRKVKLGGTTYYVSADGIYYQETTGENNNKAYKIVSIDGAGSNNQ